MAKESQNKNKKAKTTSKASTKTNKTQAKPKTTKKVEKVAKVEETVKVEKIEVKNIKKESKNLKALWWILGFVLPPVGLILYLMWKNDKKEDAKNVGTGALVATCIWAFIGLSFLLTEEPSSKKGDNKYKTVDITDCSDRIAKWYTDIINGKTVVTVIASTSCPHCQAYKPVIEDLADKEEFIMYFFESDQLESADYNALTNTFTLEGYQGYVPYTFVASNGEFVGDTTGGMDEAGLVDFLTEHKVLEN